MWTVKKVLNSSVILATDDAGAESVVLGKGIGYGRKAGEQVDPAIVDQVFVPVEPGRSSELADMLRDIPAWYLELTHTIVQMAEDRLQHALDPHIYLTLTDHLHFAVQRAGEGIAVTNRLAWEIRAFYPAEYAIGTTALRLLRERTGADLPDDEAANIAFHLVNALRGGPSSFNALRAVQLIDAVVTIVKYSAPGLDDTPTVHWSRFLTHMQFFADRFFAEKLLSSEDDFLFRQLSSRYPDATATAERVRSHIAATYQIALPNEEVGYLALHVQRLLSP